MELWIKYFIERFRPLHSLTVIVGIALSAVILDHHRFLPLTYMFSSFILFYVAFLLRLNNDIVDFDKDKIAHPARALPRKLIRKKEAEKALAYFKYGLLPLGALVFIFYGGNARTLLLLTAGYLWLILHNFYLGEWLKRHPLTKESAEQGFTFILVLFIVSLGRPELVFQPSGLAYALLMFGAFFTYNICRKLDPLSHPINLSLVHYYGLRTTYWIVIFLLLISSFCAVALDVYMWLWPCEILVAIVVSYLFANPKKFRLAELAAGLSLIIHAWCGAIQYTQ